MRKVEKNFKNCMPNQIKQLFPDLENNEAADIEEIFIGAAIGRSICHMCYDTGTNSQDIYYGRVLSIKKNNSAIYIVCSWKPNKNEDDDGIEYDMSNYLQTS